MSYIPRENLGGGCIVLGPCLDRMFHVRLPGPDYGYLSPDGGSHRYAPDAGGFETRGEALEACRKRKESAE